MDFDKVLVAFIDKHLLFQRLLKSISIRWWPNEIGLERSLMTNRLGMLNAKMMESLIFQRETRSAVNNLKEESFVFESSACSWPFVKTLINCCNHHQFRLKCFWFISDQHARRIFFDLVINHKWFTCISCDQMFRRKTDGQRKERNEFVFIEAAQIAFVINSSLLSQALMK